MLDTIMFGSMFVLGIFLGSGFVSTEVTVTQAEITDAQQACVKNGGLANIHVTHKNRTTTCADGAVFKKETK